MQEKSYRNNYFQIKAFFFANSLCGSRLQVVSNFGKKKNNNKRTCEIYGLCKTWRTLGLHLCAPKCVSCAFWVLHGWVISPILLFLDYLLTSVTLSVFDHIICVTLDINLFIFAKNVFSGFCTKAAKPNIDRDTMLANYEF